MSDAKELLEEIARNTKQTADDTREIKEFLLSLKGKSDVVENYIRVLSL